jgi:hypothetical protein
MAEKQPLNAVDHTVLACLQAIATAEDPVRLRDIANHVNAQALSADCKPRDNTHLRGVLRKLTGHGYVATSQPRTYLLYAANPGSPANTYREDYPPDITPCNVTIQVPTIYRFAQYPASGTLSPIQAFIAESAKNFWGIEMDSA